MTHMNTPLNKFPRISLGHFPTPLEPMDNLRKVLGGGPRLFIKRDDCTGLATGGNKTRKLEFLMADAIEHSAQVVVTQGAVQSNHVRQTAAAAVRCEMECTALLERRVPNTDDNYEKTGNPLLNDIIGMRYEFRDAGTEMNAEAEALSKKIEKSGKRSYFIPGGGSNEIGALGYVDCVIEMTKQIEKSNSNIDWLVHATGSAGTQAGILAGFTAIDSPIKTLGVSVRANASTQKKQLVPSRKKRWVDWTPQKKLTLIA